jgi:protein ImuB
MERQGRMGVMPPLYVCVFVPEFPAQALLRHRPELARAPVAVVEGDPPLEQVCSASRAALRLGVARGMTRAELDTFPGLTILRRSLIEERSARTALLEAAGLFTPRVEIQRATADDVFAMVLDMAGTARIFGTPAEAARRIARKLHALRFFARLATAANLHAAVCAAPAARGGPLVLAPGEEAARLGRLPLAALGLSPQQAETLALWGLKTLGELAALPEVDLVVRLGQEGKRLRLLARGEFPHLMVPEEPVFALEESVEFDAPVELLEPLLFVLGPMLDQIVQRARNRAYALASVTVRLGLEGGGEHERTLKPALPVAERAILLKLLHLDLQAHPPPAGVVHIFVQAEPGDRSKVQLGLFAPQLPDPTRLDVTLARIAALVGEERVGRAKLLDSHGPDAFAMERFVVTSAKGGDIPARTSVALRRCRPPIAVQMRRSGQQLESFSLHSRRYTVQQAFGPWRRSGRWWSADVWSREEWDVRGAAEGDTLLCVLSHDLLRNHWQLDALYD